MKMWWAALVALIVILALIFVFYRLALRPTPIERILEDPRAFDERIVSVKGEVKRSLGLLGFGGYEVDDGTGRITVVTDAGLPPSGAEVTVRGIAKNAYTIGDKSLTVIIEKRRGGHRLLKHATSGRAD